MSKNGIIYAIRLFHYKNMTQRNLKVEFFGAGGLRDRDDYEIVARYKAAGWLVGSALFNSMMDFGDE